MQVVPLLAIGQLRDGDAVVSQVSLDREFDAMGNKEVRRDRIDLYVRRSFAKMVIDHHSRFNVFKAYRTRLLAVVRSSVSCSSSGVSFAICSLSGSTGATKQVSKRKRGHKAPASAPKMPNMGSATHAGG
jgi:hypothetical protein